MDDIDWDNLPKSTTPVGLNVRVIGFDNQEAATTLGRAVAEAVAVFGSFMDLSTLDGVTVGFDYDYALASIDQGMDGLPPLDRTDSDELQGVAKACRVVRDGVVKTHLVFGAEQLVPLIAGDAVTTVDRQFSIGLIAHECGHVEVNAMNERFVPDARLGAVIAEYDRAMMLPAAVIFWDEYAVCRLSAPFARNQNAGHADSVAGVTSGARIRSDAHIRAHRLHQNHLRTLGETATELVTPLKTVSYLLGGMDAEGTGWEDFPETRRIIETAGYGELVDDLHRELQLMWDTRDRWDQDDDVFAPIVEIVREALASGGVTLDRKPDGSWHANFRWLG